MPCIEVTHYIRNGSGYSSLIVTANSVKRKYIGNIFVAFTSFELFFDILRMDKASLYARSNALQRRDAAAALQTYLPQMVWSDDEESVLDVGCGSGLSGTSPPDMVTPTNSRGTY